MWFAVLLRLQFFIFSCLLARCCSSLMNRDAIRAVIRAVIHDIAVSWLCCVLLCTCRSWIPWHMIAQHISVIGSLALSCPPHTRHLVLWHLVAQLYAILNSTTWYFVDTRVPNTCPVNLVVHTSSISLDKLHHAVIYYVTSIFIRRLYVIHHGHIILRLHDLAALCIYFIHVIHYVPWRPLPWTLLLYGRELIGTPVRLDFSMLHSVCIRATLFVSTIWDLITLQYYLMELLLLLWCSPSSILRYTEPLVICWFSGHYVMLPSQLSWLCA